MGDATFTALHTRRLVVRRFWPEDLDAFVAYRVERGKHRVTATCDDRNTSSVAVLERVGMRREGRLLESTWSKGGRVPPSRLSPV